MSRTVVQQTLSKFFDRAACATVADMGFMRSYISSLNSYISEPEECFDPIDSLLAYIYLLFKDRDCLMRCAQNPRDTSLRGLIVAGPV